MRIHPILTAAGWKATEYASGKSGEGPNRARDLVAAAGRGVITISPVIHAKGGNRESLLLSGCREHDELIRGKPKALDVPFEKGRMILFGFNFHDRAQSHATFKLLFNSLY